MPFQAIKLTCILESEVQTLKTKVSPHREDSNKELFFLSAMLRSLIFHLQNHCLQLHVDVEKTLLWSSACTQESTMQELLLHA